MKVKSFCLIFGLLFIVSCMKAPVKESFDKNNLELDSQLLTAVEDGNPDEVNKLLKLGANVNAADPNFATSLIIASRSGNVEL